MQRSPDRNELKNYLKTNVDPVIEPLVVAILKKRPVDIYDFSIKYLQDNKPKAESKPASRAASQQQERPVTPAQLDKPTTPIQTEKAEFYAEQVKEAQAEEVKEAETEVKETEAEVKEPQPVEVKDISQAKISDQAQLGSDVDDEEDEDVGDLAEIDTLKNQKKGSRASVSAEVYGRFNKKEDFVARVIEKTPEQKQKIVDKLSKAFMFASLEEKEKDIVINAMEVKQVKAGDQIINQGDDGAELYIVGEGELDCSKRFKPDEEEKYLKVYLPGESFGELALLYNAPRAASIKAKTDAELYALDRATFNNIVKDAEVKRRERFEDILSKIELLESMDPYERSKVSDVAAIVKVKNGEHVIKQGEQGDKFFFVEDGTAVATKVLQGKEEAETVYEYKPGDYFGELALLKDEPRAANVIATSDMTLLALEREAFNRVLGPLIDILKRNAEKYEKFK